MLRFNREKQTHLKQLRVTLKQDYVRDVIMLRRKLMFVSDLFSLSRLIEQNESKHDGSPSPGMTDQEKEVAASAYEAFLVTQHPFKHWYKLFNLGCTS